MKTGILILAVAGLLGLGTRAQAIPTLQTYIDGAVYDDLTDTWVTTSSTFTLWVVGNVGAVGPIYDVHLAAAYYWGEVGTMTITELGDAATPVFDLYGPDGVTQVADVNGAIPIMEDGNDLPSHGVYGAGRAFKQWYLGDFTSTDDSIQDYAPGEPPGTGTGQINKYTFEITGFTAVHFDVYNHVEGARKSSFNPFSHDGEQIPPVPEPATLSTIVLGLGLAAVSGFGIRRRKRG